ncbi:MAG: hypothetical protein WBO10_02400 [Pyrinomonadaceae bacterium]
MFCNGKFLGILLTALLAGSWTSVYSQPDCKGRDILAARTCAGDGLSPDETALFQLVSRYRAANSLPALKLSKSLSLVANRHLLDLQRNLKRFTHSWSDCDYDIAREKTWPCINNAPKRLNSGYDGQGYETLYRTATDKASGPAALDAWKKSSLHNSIILNLGMFKDIPWNEVGMAIDGPYVAFWFGSPALAKSVVSSGLGLGVTYAEAIAGLEKIFSISQSDTSVGQNKWQGISTDKTVNLELLGNRADLSNASLAISMKLKGGRMSTQARTALGTLLKNMFPEWSGRDAWIDSTIAAIVANPTASRTKIVRKIDVSISGDRSATLRLLIQPASKPSAVEIF